MHYLKVGDVLYSFSAFSFIHRPTQRHVITRVTSTRAMIKAQYGSGKEYELQFEIEQSDPSYFRARGRNNYDSETYSLETDKLKAAYDKYNTERTLYETIDQLKKKAGNGSLTGEQMKEIIDFIAKYTGA